MRKIAVMDTRTIVIGRVGENEAAQVVWPGLLSKWRGLYGEGTVQLAVRRALDKSPYPAVCAVDGDDVTWTVSAADTAQHGTGECELSYLMGDVVVKSQTWATLTLRSLTGEEPGEPPEDPAKAWFSAIQSQIGDLDDLTTKAKQNLVAAINEAAKSGSGGGGSVEMRVADGYIQYSTDGETWENLIAVADLKGDTGPQGPKGDTGTPGQDGYSPSASVAETDDGAEITITDKTGTTTATVKNGKDGAAGAAGSPGKDGVTPNIQIGTVTTLDAGADATASMTGTAAEPLLNLGIPKGADGSEKDWEVVADVIVESEDVTYYRYDVTDKTEVYVMVSLTPLADSTSPANGNIGINGVASPWSPGPNGHGIMGNIQAVKTTSKGMTYIVSGKIINGKWSPHILLSSQNADGAWNSVQPKGSEFFVSDGTTNVLSLFDVDKITSIAVGSYTNFFGVGSHIYILAR